MINERLTVRNGRLVNGSYYYDPIYINDGIFAIIYPPEVGKDTDHVIYYCFKSMEEIPIRIGLDMYIHYRPIFISKKEIAEISKSRSYNGNDIITYYEEYMKVSFRKNSTYFNPKDYYEAFLEKKWRKKEEERKKRKNMKHI